MDKDVMIRVEGVSKRYTLGRNHGTRGYTALRDVLSDRVRRLWRKGNLEADLAADTTDFWALRDVTFEVRRGEVVGIIGRNGAGKSTLLKILSRITEPTNGTIRLRGRVASLLEVGTGFHPELTGRENIYLNGAILGMHRVEIKAKFDEIVAFAEVEKFLDTPVKRYSSGMYVRLAFAVAAHLEPEILIVDEVLAVGDAEFQKKCLGKMGEVARGGRTVLFVSHNMAAVKSLTTRALVLKQGRLQFQGTTSDAIAFYVEQIGRGRGDRTSIRSKGLHTQIMDVAITTGDANPANYIEPGQPFTIHVTLTTDGHSGLSLDFLLSEVVGGKLALGSTAFFAEKYLPNQPGTYCCSCRFEGMWLASGDYHLDVATAIPHAAWDHYVDKAVDFSVLNCNPAGLPFDFKQSYGFGNLALNFCEPPVFAAVSPGPTP